MSYFTSRCRLIIGATLLCQFFLLTGCAGMNSQFSCPMKPGQLCSSLDRVNRMVDQGKIGKHTNDTNSLTANTSTSTDTISSNITPYPLAAINSGDSLRSSESVLRIWVAPYEDKAGNYHQPGVMYAVVKPGRWIGNPIQAAAFDE